MQTLSFTQLPSPWTFYKRVITNSKPKFKEGDSIEPINVSWNSFRFSKDMIKKYSQLCELAVSDDQVPVLFPHSYFGPLHLAMLTDKGFPMKLLGAVHLRNHLIQHRPLSCSEDYNVNMLLQDYRRRPQGLEVDFSTKIVHDNQLVWESVTTFLFRKKFLEIDSDSPLAEKIQAPESATKFQTFSVPSNTGKKFGMLTKDINPIHMSKLLAKLFGFKRDLCHGMWAIGRATGLMNHVDINKPIRCDLAFKGPLYMEKDISIQLESSTGKFELYSKGNERPCVLGLFANVASGSKI